MMQARDVFFSGVIGEEGFQPEVEARDFTRRDLIRNDSLLNHTEEQPQSTRSIPFDRDGFHIPAQRTMFHKLVGAPTDLNLIAVQQLPPRLFECEGFALAHLLVPGWTFGKALEKALVARIQAFQHILNSLRTQLLPEGIADGSHPQVGDVGLQFTERDVFPREAVIAFVQRQRVIPDRSGDVDLAMQMLIAFVAAVEAKLVGFANFNHDDCPSMYRSITAALTFPAVRQK